MADDGKLYLDWELRGNVEKQIKSTLDDAEKLQKALESAGKSVGDLDASKMTKNLNKNINDATKAISDLLIMKSKLDETIERRSTKSSDFVFDDSKLRSFSFQIDNIIKRILEIGPAASLSANAVKDLAAEMSIDVIKKGSKEEIKKFESAEKAYNKQRKEDARDAAKSEKEEEDARARSAQNMQKIQDAMSKIATARSNLSKVSAAANEEESMHVKLLLNLLDQLSSKLASLKKTDLSAKDAVTNVLGSGYQNLMRNVTTAIADLASGKLNTMGASDEEWNQEKLLATRREITATFEKEYENQEKVNQLVRERQQMEAHRKARETAKDEAEVEAIARQVNRELAEREKLNRMLDQNKASYAALEKLQKDAESQSRIAVIQRKTAEYNALQRKLADIEALMAAVKKEEEDLSNGTKKAPDLTKEVITKRLDEIQRQYNEDLVRGRQALLDEADAEKKNADAKRRTTAAARELNRVNAEMVDSFNKVLDRVTHNSRMMGQLQQQFAGYVGVYGLERLLKSVIQIGGEFEVQHIALQSILGDIQQANSMFEQMKELAVVSPFNFRQLATYSKQIAAFNVPYEEMYDTTKRLADMAAGLGVDMGRLILAYGQVRSAAVLRGQELRQFTEAGIPMVQALANEFTKLNGRAVSTAEVFELISKRAVPFEMVKKVMWDMTNEGGRFFDMQFVLSDTLAGKWSNLQDAWEIMLSEIAKGESLSGQFLKFMVTSLTRLTEAVNTLMPVLSGFAMFFAGRKIVDYFGNTGLNGINNYIKKAQMLQSIELRRRLINGEITREQYKQQMAMNNSQARYYLLLAQEGRLKDYQIRRLITQKQINNAKLQELVETKEITMREAAQIRLWMMKNKELSAFQMRLNSIAGGIGSFFKTNGWLIAIDIAITALTTYISHANEVQQKNKELSDGFAKTSSEIRDTIKSLSDNTLSSDDDYKNGIEGLKEMLKQYSANYEAIIREAQALGTLKEQYDYLRSSMSKQQKVMEDAESKSIAFGEATRSAFEDANETARYVTTGRQSFWDVLLGADTNIQRGLNTAVKKLSEKIKEQIPDIGKSEDSNELYRQLRNSIEEQLGMGQKEKMLVNIKLNEIFNVDNIEDATTLVVDKFGEMLSKAAPQIANKIRFGKELNQAEKDKVAELVKEAAKETEARYPYYAKTLQGLLNDSNFIANIQLRFSTSGLKVNDLQRFIYGNFEGPIDESIKNIATNWGTSNSLFTARNSAKKDIDEAYNELVARRSVLNKLEGEAVKNNEQISSATKLVNEANTRYTNLRDAALYGLGYDYEGEKKKSNKDKNPKKTDDSLERLKNRVDLYKKFYSELESATKILGKQGALDFLKRNGFDAVFKFGLSDVTDYAKSLNELTNKFEANTEARKKFLNTTDADIVSQKRKEETESIKNYVSELQRMLDIMAENYKLYKKWVDLTGDTRLASGIAGVAQNSSYSAYIKEQMEQALKDAGKNVSAESILSLDLGTIKNYGEESAIFKLWDAYRKEQERVRKEDMDELYNATKKLMSVDDEILAIEKQIQALREKGVKDTDSRILVKEQELKAKLAEQFENSEPYLKFYAAILSMTASEAENVGAAIKKNLIDQLANGTINADKYLRSLKNVDAQLKKIRSDKNTFLTLSTSGVKGLKERDINRQNDVVAENAIKIEKAQKELLAAERELQQVTEEGDRMSIANAEMRVRLAQEELTKLQSLQIKEQQLLEKLVGDWSKAEDLIAVFDMISSGIDGLSQGAQQLSDMFAALGQTERSEGWSDASDIIGVIGSPIKSVTNVAKSALNGDLGGIISNTVGIITSPVTALAKLHDKKLDRAIQRSVREVKKLGNEYNNIVTAMEKALGGIYSSGGYNEMLKNLKQQRAEIQSQYNNERDKKDSDADKLIDYQQQLVEMDRQIKDFALDMANTLYSIDLHSIASQLTDTVVSAWEKGEDAAEAYREKVKDIVKDISTNILTKKVMESAFSRLGIDKIIENEMVSKEGKLDEGSVIRVAKALNQAGEITVNAITGILDQLEKEGYINKGSESSSNSSSSSIKNITEETADILASYVNAIRADVAYTRITLENIYNAIHGDDSMPVIAQAQLDQLKLIVANTNKNAEAAAKIYDLLHAIAPDGQRVRVQ